MNEKENRDDEIEIDLVEIWGILKKKASFIAAISFIFVAAAVSYCFIKAPTYQSVSIISADSKQMNFFQTRDVLEPIMKEYVSTEGEKAPSFDAFKQNIKFNQAKGSSDTTITVTANSPETAQQINQAIIDGGRALFIKITEKRLEVSIQYAESALARINENVANAEKELSQSDSSRTNSISYDTRMTKLHTILDSKMKAIENIEILRKQQAELAVVFPVLQTPTFEEIPVAPQKLKTCSIALVFGLFAGCLLAICKEKLL